MGLVQVGRYCCTYALFGSIAAHELETMDDTQQFFALGSDCTLRFCEADATIASRAATAAINEISRIEARFSRYRHDSELSRINEVATAGGTVVVDEETGALLDYAFACYRLSGGLFDITSGPLRTVWDFARRVFPAKTTSPLSSRGSGSIRSDGLSQS